jgi:hypothetical protein
MSLWRINELVVFNTRSRISLQTEHQHWQDGFGYEGSPHFFDPLYDGQIPLISYHLSLYLSCKSLQYVLRPVG